MAKKVTAKKVKSAINTYRRARKAISKPKPNPPIGEDLVEFIVPGFIAYAATRLGARIVHAVASKRFPNGGKHLAVASSVGAAAGAWFAVHRIPSIEKYHTPAVVGASIAALQTTVQAYLPQFGWMMGDLDSTAAAATVIEAPTGNGKALPEPTADESEAQAEDIAGLIGAGSLTQGYLSDSLLDQLEAEAGIH